MGTATAWPLSDNGHTVRLVGTHLDKNIIESCKADHYHPRLKRRLPAGVYPFYVEEIGEALDGVEIIVSGVNSLGVHWVGKTIGPHLKPGQMVIAVTKGLEAGADGKPLILPDVLYQELPSAVRKQVSLAAIGGPCIAGELAGRHSSCVVFGSRHAPAVESLASVFRTSYYNIWTTTDLLSLELCAALKNAYTLGVGIAAGLLERQGGVDEADAAMHNLAAGLFAQGCTEIARVLTLCGGNPSFAYGLPGAGDFFVTVQGGRSMRLGKLLGSGKSYQEARQIMRGETLEAAEIVMEISKILPTLLSIHGSRGNASQALPLLQMLVDIVVNGRTVDPPLADFFSGSYLSK